MPAVFSDSESPLASIRTVAKSLDSRTIVENDVLSLPTSGFSYDWTGQVQKDLRSAAGVPERGRYSRIYCGGPVRQPTRGLHGAALRGDRRHCRAVLLRTLKAAIAAVTKRQGRNVHKWKVLATCLSFATSSGVMTRPPSRMRLMT